ncbi:hypothetical protein [Nitrososphaera viennensis]|nr:hypothetical protein [Nitrososphaera viennensis]UVS69359.1 hypothetical protein NWT39_00900 [Nitrososphaera viennensis]
MLYMSANNNNNNSNKTKFSILAIAIVASAAIAIIMQMTSYATAQQQNSSTIVRVQKTVMSAPAPVTAQGHPTHQVVFALPLRDDGRIWSGTVTFTASKPIEIEVMHRYNPAVAPTAEYGQPPVAVINGTTITYSHMTGIVDTPILSGDSPISSGTFDFTGSALLFHKRSGEPFTVTYTIDAVAKTLTQ